jgi:NAD(P)-dependent dehydrogenase (short-subunit alcohol dehydrogenase family)
MEPMSGWCDLSGQVALVTGASRGIGRGVALALAAAGAKVACHATKASNCTQTVEQIKEIGGTAFAVGGDASREEDVAGVVEATRASFDRIDILVNNAGYLLAKPFKDISASEWRAQMDVNVTGMYLFARKVLAEMVQAGRGGSVVNMGSTFGALGVKECVAYCTTKAATDAFTRSLAVEYARYGVRVNCIAPGYIETDLTKAALDNEKVAKAIISKIPLRRIGTPDDIGPLTAFLCSKAASFMTGQTIYVDGGEGIAW